MNYKFPQNVCESCHVDLAEHVESESIGIVTDVDPPPTYDPCDLCGEELSGDGYHALSKVRCSDEVAAQVQSRIHACEQDGCGRVWDSGDKEWLFDETNNDLLSVFSTVVSGFRDDDAYRRLLLWLDRHGLLDRVDLPEIRCQKCSTDFDDWYQEVKTRVVRRLDEVPALLDTITSIPAATASPSEVIEFYRSDCSNALVNLTKGAELEYVSSNIEGESKSRSFSAQEVLFIILTQRTLRAFKGKGLHAPAVCFTEKPLTALKDTLLGNEASVRKNKRAIEWEPYGLMFPKEYLRGLGASPVLQMSPSDELKLPPELKHRVVPFTAGSNWNHEREWRYGSDLRFDPRQAVVLLPRFEQVNAFQDALVKANIRVSGFLPLFDLFACM